MVEKADAIKEDTTKILGELKELKERKAMESAPSETLFVKLFNGLGVGQLTRFLHVWKIPFDRDSKKAGKAQLLAQEAMSRVGLAKELDKILANPASWSVQLEAVSEELEDEAAAEAFLKEQEEMSGGISEGARGDGWREHIRGKSRAEIKTLRDADVKERPKRGQ